MGVYVSKSAGFAGYGQHVSARAMVKVDIEHFSSGLRVWYDDSAEYGDGYDWNVTVRWFNKEEVEFTLLQCAPNEEAWRAVQSFFAGLGVKRILMKRCKRGKWREKWIKTEWRNSGLPSESLAAEENWQCPSE